MTPEVAPVNSNGAHAATAAPDTALLLSTSANPLDTTDSTIRPRVSAVFPDHLRAVPEQNCPEPKELLATEANPIDAPDSVVRPPKEAVLTPQQQQEQASVLQSREAANGAFSGAGGMQAAERFNDDGFVNVERYLSQQGRDFRPAGITSLICEFAGLSGVVSLHGGLPPDAAFPITGATLQLADGGSISLDDPALVAAAQQYNTSAAGYEPLRQWAEGMVQDLHSPPSPHDVIITTGSNHAVDLTLALLLDRGGALLVEEYTYPHMLEGVVESKGYSPVSVPMDGDGYIPAALRQVLDARRQMPGLPQPRILYTVPTGQNPTGLIMPLERRKELYAIACEYDLLIMEDDPYVFLQFREGDVPGLKELGESFLSLDVEGRVVRFDSCSKFLAPGFRIGWAAMPPALARKLEMAQFASSLGPTPFSQVILSKLLSSWGAEGLEAHVRKTQLEYWHRASAMHRAASQELAGLAEWHAPRAGMFLWIKLLQPPRDESALVAALRDHKVVVVPGRIGHVRGRDPSFECPYLRMAWSYCAFEDLSDGMKRLGAALRDCAGR
mmetsp:Transcript_1187/g.3548  ORF Transcript_1187/g.3548 Transcript_1187/m.3548 type:complete len:556 (-) Transcript_1187:3167-4834(-)|eukprot:CAMPEP_0206135892 /NCGR_PEP_ID=MMETSP1473-20131121/1157_1 /ASSEMBLY_ACC=CAM_ASM_001109 /TAXON_ID=1461547 /ORGANISM="Stichococcus sp, Strain RCC1054" /LENGTH=555 /DNA_ID=CAMNT_0053528051 /DNA_START=188 /DNA_END=1855 /DNA_ORIENTATION=+